MGSVYKVLPAPLRDIGLIETDRNSMLEYFLLQNMNLPNWESLEGYSLNAERLEYYSLDELARWVTGRSEGDILRFFYPPIYEQRPERAVIAEKNNSKGLGGGSRAVVSLILYLIY